MRIIVADQLKRVRLVLRRHQRELRVRLDGAHDVDQFAIHARGDGRFGQAGADGGRDLPRRGPARNLALRAIGERNLHQFRHRFRSCLRACA